MRGILLVSLISLLSIHVSAQKEFLVDTSIVYLPSPENQQYPSISFDGTNHLVVWQDTRFGIRGTRVTPSGEILDPLGLQMSLSSGSNRSSSVAFDGVNYFVAWEHNEDIYGTRVTQDGDVLDSSAIVISIAPGFQQNPYVAFNGTDYLVVWQDSRADLNDDDIYGARVTPSGEVLDTGGIAISIAAYDQEEPCVVFGGQYCLVVWGDRRNNRSSSIYGARVDQSGTVLDSAGIPISNVLSMQASVAFDGVNYLVVWNDLRTASSFDVYGARVAQSGTVLDPAGIRICAEEDVVWITSVAFDSMNYLVTWSSSDGFFYNIYGTRVTPSGAVLDVPSIPISLGIPGGSDPATSFGDTAYLVVWQKTPPYSGDPDIYGTGVGRTGRVSDTAGILISTTASEQHSPCVAFNGMDYLVVWSRWCYDEYCDVYGLRMDEFGRAQDTTTIPIASIVGRKRCPCVASNSVDFLVVWDNWDLYKAYDVYAARVNSSGELLDSIGIEVSFAATSVKPSVSSNGNEYLVVWEYNSDTCHIYGARVTPTGTVLDPAGIRISSEGSHSEPFGGWDGMNYLVVWRDNCDGDLSIRGARVTSIGEVLDTTGIAISDTARSPRNPCIAFGTANCLVVWEDDYRIYGARVNRSGVVLDATRILISGSSSTQRYLSAAFDGTDYVVIWQDNEHSEDQDIHGAKVNASGQVTDSFELSACAGDQIEPFLVRGAGTQLLATYSGWTDEMNTMRIKGTFSPFAGVEENSDLAPRFREFRGSPNPFLHSTTITYQVPVSRGSPALQSRVSLSIHDLAGRRVKVLVHAYKESGRYEVSCDAGELTAGVYFARLVIGENHKETEKLILLRQ